MTSQEVTCEYLGLYLGRFAGPSFRERRELNGGHQ